MTSQPRYLRFGVLVAAVIMMTQVAADWERYQEGTLQSIIEMHDEAWQSDTALSAKQFPTKAMVVYTGELRPLPPVRAAFLDKYYEMMNLPEARELYTSEISVTENGHRHWIPIQETLVKGVKDDVEPGDRITIYAIWLGGVTEGDTRSWMFAVNAFDSYRKKE